jgi:hypothetical protein
MPLSANHSFFHFCGIPFLWEEFFIPQNWNATELKLKIIGLRNERSQKMLLSANHSFFHFCGTLLLWEDQDYFAEFLALKVQILFTE